MNYVGKYGNHYEIPSNLKRYSFTSTGVKLLAPYGVFGFVIKNPIFIGMDEYYLSINIENDIHEIEKNIGTQCPYKKIRFSNDEFVFEIVDPIAPILEKMEISKKEASLLSDPQYYHGVRNVGQLISDFYDPDTEVEILSKNRELFIKEKARNILLITKICNCGVEDYYDDCYSNHSVAITPNGMNRMAIYDEIDEKRKYMN